MTQLTQFQQQIAAFLPNISYKYNELLSRHTSFRIGGKAEVMAFPQNAEELTKLLTAAKQCNVAPRILGAGTNVLAPDEGVEGLVICLKGALVGKEDLGGGLLRIYAGETMTNAAAFAANLGLSGLEFAHGIPGTVGGGVYMNAGAYGGEIAGVCTRVCIMDEGGNQRLLTREECGFSYRNSRFQMENAMILFAEFQLHPQPAVDIWDTMYQLKARRSASQPLDKPSAGSAFKRPATGYAAAMIDGAGLKGFRIGGAAVSEKHAGFVVNLGEATAADVKALLSAVADQVEKKTGVRLEPEIRIW